MGIVEMWANGDVTRFPYFYSHRAGSGYILVNVARIWAGKI
jgi:hypothetical protein